MLQRIRSKKLTRAQAESNSAQEVVASEAVMVPYGKLQASFPQIVPGDLLEHKRVVPPGVALFLLDTRFLFRMFGLFWQQIPENGAKIAA